MKNCGHETHPPNINVPFSRSIRNELAIARGTSGSRLAVRRQSSGSAQRRDPDSISNASFYVLIWQYRAMAFWPTVRLGVTLSILLLAAAEIFACPLISPDTCIFSTHTTGDSDEGCSGDGCLCCCAHIVVVAPITPLAPLGFISRAVPFEDIQTPDFPPSRIEHPPRF